MRLNNSIKYSLLFLSLLVLSCTSRYKVPEDIIQQQKMADIMWDVVTAQTLATELNIKDSSVSVAATAVRLTSEVYRIHGINKAEYDKSYAWYLNRPDLFRVVFDSLYTQQQRNNVPTLQKRYDRMKQDSLRSKFLKNAKGL